MTLTKMIAIGLLVAGALGLAYGGFSYTRETHEAELGPLSVSVEENDYVNVPVWASLGALLVGAALLLRGKT
ncbi:MAG: hypothetical protein WD772_09080 [Pseudohongiellaceae bacterium]